MTIVQLEYLLAVVNFGSFSLAAERCFVTQPSLSMQIKNLEEELGVVLLDRSKKPVMLTQAGGVVVERARDVIKTYNSVFEDVAVLKGNVSGVLKLGVIPTIAPYLLPKMVQDFAERCPNVELEIKEMITPDIIRAMERDEVDAAILAGGTCPSGIAEEELFDDRFYAYISPENTLYERSNIRVEDLNLKEILLLSEGHCFRDQILDFCPSKGGRRHVSYYFESGSLETLMRIVDSTEYMTIIPEMALPYIPEEHRSQIKTLAKGAVSRKIAVAVRRTYVKDTLVKALKESILSCREGMNLKI
jgi:LysR family hydrogen peroxide-inducible transcriptional activator